MTSSPKHIQIENLRRQLYVHKKGGEIMYSQLLNIEKKLFYQYKGKEMLLFSTLERRKLELRQMPSETSQLSV